MYSAFSVKEFLVYLVSFRVIAHLSKEEREPTETVQYLRDLSGLWLLISPYLSQI